MKKAKIGSVVLMSFALVIMVNITGCSIKSKGSNEALNTASPAKGETSSSSSSQPTLKLRFGNTAVQGSTLYDASNLFKKEVEDKTKGTVQIDYLSNGVLGGDAQVVQQIVAGTTDINVTDLGLFSSYDKKLSALSLPFLYSSLEQAWKVMDSQIGQDLANGLIAKGIHPLAYWENGFRDLTTKSKLVKTAGDLNGLKIRTPQIPASLQLWKTLGSNPTPMDLGQVYMGLSQGVVEGQENPLEIINNNKLYEVEKYLILTHHVYSPTILVMSEQSWSKLNPDQQKMVVEAAKDVAKIHRQNTKQHSDELLKTMKEKLTVVQPDLESFKKAAEPMYKWAETEYGADVVKAVKDEVEKDK